MDCVRFRESLALTPGQELEGVSAAELGRHMGSCPRCRAIAQSFGRQRTLLSSYARQKNLKPSAGPDLWSSLRERLEVPAALKRVRSRGG